MSAHVPRGARPSEARVHGGSYGRGAPTHEPWLQKLRNLMPFIVREILLVSSAYDAFTLEEDGHLEERLFSAYTDLSLSASPRITHVTSEAQAVSLLSERHFDLVITVLRLEDTDAAALARAVKARRPDLPVVLLAFDETDIAQLPGGVVPASIDRAFLWTGDTRILLAAIKLVEDARNLDHDIRAAGVQLIVVVEDKLRPYSTFLALLYSELKAHAHSLIAEGLNDLHKVMRMQARPKIVLATTFEEAERLLDGYREHVLAVVSDVRFPRGGREDPEAGLELVRRVRARHPDLPILLQSAEVDVGARVAALGVAHVAKNAPTLVDQIRRFLKEALGFGDFVFRMPDRREVARARDLYELESALSTVPAESLVYHASRNHFSTWLNARGMFSLATRVKPRRVDEFGDADALRKYLLEVLRAELSQVQEGMIADYSPHRGGSDRQLVRLASGSIGGKGRGIAFVSSLLVAESFADRFDRLAIRIPRTVVVGTGAFDRFMEDASISRDDLERMDDAEVTRRFLRVELRPELLLDLEATLRDFDGPLAVRSSSLLEDSRFRPFAGVYATYMLPNTHVDPALRFGEVCRAIKAVYASTFSRNAKSYLAGTPHTIAEEKMGIVIQQVVGRRYESRFYPAFAGVAQSYNYYPVGPQRADEGIAIVALGLGHAVVSGRTGLRFSPASPAALPQLASVRSFVKSSQTEFFALDLSRADIDFVARPESSLLRCSLEDAERDGPLSLVASSYSPADDVLRDSLGHGGPRVVTFHNLLKWELIPLAPALRALLECFRKGTGGEVEIEFAVDMAPGARTATLYVVQIRPMLTAVDLPNGDGAESVSGTVLCRTARALGHGITRLRDIVYVRTERLDGTGTRDVAQQLAKINARLRHERAPYLLIGPGRWGSADPSLGIPVEWTHITGARVIVEMPWGDRSIEPSQGTHFFQNITSQRIGYLAVSHAAPSTTGDFLDLAWLDRQPAVEELPRVRHVRVDPPMRVRIDGPLGQALVWQPDTGD